MAVFRVAKMVSGYPLTSAGPYRVFRTREDALAALGPHEECHGDYAGTFNPRHPAATDYYVIARSTRDPHLVAVTDTPEG